MKRLLFFLIAASSMLTLSSTTDRSDALPYGALHIINIPGIADDVVVSFFQSGANSLSVHGSQIGYEPGGATITLSASSVAQHFSQAGYNPENAISIKITLLDETGDTMNDPTVGSFYMNPSGPTVIDYTSL